MNPITLLVLANPAEPELALLDELRGMAVIVIGDTPAAWESLAPQAEVILNWTSGSSLLQQVWPMMTRLQWMQTRSAGLDGILFPALADSPVTLTNARGAFSEILAEFTIGAVLFFAKDFRRLVTSQVVGKWDPFDVIEIRGQTLGLVGYGDIGRAVARYARAFGMDVVALKRQPELTRDDPHVSRVFPPEGKHDMLRLSDYVVVAAPLTPESRGMIAAPEFEAMKPSAVLINIGRGPVVDEPALIQALRAQRIRGAALDVFETEPLPAGHPFYSFDNVLLSPHSADQTSDWKERSMRLFLENFHRYRSGEPLLNVVNKKLGY
jgi:phosphoglycerate dehydrogenase-like enzyme